MKRPRMEVVRDAARAVLRRMTEPLRWAVHMIRRTVAALVERGAESGSLLGRVTASGYGESVPREIVISR